MLTGNQPAPNQLQERRSESHQLIEELIHTRTELLLLYAQLAGNTPFADELDEETQETLTEFCEILIDYTADAHFRLYRFIDENKEKRKAVLDIAESSYQRITEITQTILDFNDRYFRDPDHDDAGSSNDIAVKTLESDLSQLGEILAERIELEDMLIEAMVRGRKAPAKA